MGVTLQKQTAPAVQPPAAPVPPATMVLELGGKLQRYGVAGQVFVAGSAYKVTEKQAQKMFRLKDENGVPIFREWRPKPKVRRLTADGPALIDMTMGNTQKQGFESRKLDAGDNEKKQDRIDIGDDDELRAAGIILPEDEEGDGDLPIVDDPITADDLNGAVSV